MKSYNYKIIILFILILLIPGLIVRTSLILNLHGDIQDINKVLIISMSVIMDSILMMILLNWLKNKSRIDCDAIDKINSRIISEQKLKLKINQLDSLKKELIETKNTLYNHEKDLMAEFVLNENEMEKVSHKITDLERELNLVTILDNSIMSLTNQFLIWIDDKGIIKKINRAFVKRLGYSEEELVDKNINSLVIDDKNILLSDKDDMTQVEWLEQLKSASQKPLYVLMRIQALSEGAVENVSLLTLQLSDYTLLCIGKAVNDEIAMQSNILRKNRELEYINQINASLISNWDIDALLDNIIKRIDYLFNIKFGGIYVMDSEGKWSLKSFASKKFTLDDIREMELTRYIENYVNKDGHLKTIEISNERMKYLVISPMIVASEIIAVIVIATDQEMSANDIGILKMFKNQTSMVIQRAIIYDQLRDHYFGTIEALVNVIEAKDKYTEGHSRRVSRFSIEIAKELGYSNEEIENVEIAGLLHDIGKIGVDQNILTKRGKLTSEEYDAIKEHPEKGIQILEAINLERDIQEGILYHHLRYDLKGYPAASIEKLPVYACIIGIADAFDAMTSARSYNLARSKEEALNELIKYSGTQFDPAMVSIMKQIMEQKPENLQNIIDDMESIYNAS